MGLDNRDKGKYITILGGKFCVRVQENEEGAVQRTNKLGKVVWEKFYDSFTGKLANITTKDGEYGKTWNFSFIDEETPDAPYILQLSYSNSYATALLKMLPNIDLSKPFKLSPSAKIVDGKTQSSLFANQDGHTIKHAYTKDVPNGLPQMEQITIKGQLVWDDTARLVFLQNMVDTQILPKLDQTPLQGQSHVPREQDSKKAFEEMTAGAPVVEDEDSPF